MSLTVRMIPTLILATTATAQQLDSWDWALAAQERVWEQLKASVPAFASPTDDGWSATVVAQDGWSRTAELRLSRTNDGNISLAYVRTLRGNLLSQLHSLRERTPDLDATDAAPLLDVQTGTLKDDCPGLSQLAASLSEVTIRVLPNDYLSLHGAGYSVTLETTFRGTRELHVNDGENDLAQWCGALLEVVQRCHRAR